MYIYRELQEKIDSYFSSTLPKGLILTGVVGCGKTTLIDKCLEGFSQSGSGTGYSVFKFTCDDLQFREAISQNTKHIEETVRSQTQKKALIFIDEVQKSENVFDALKYAFDKSQISFIVSGSNPAYLATEAKKRLQRRAELFFMLPFSMSEILCSEKLSSQDLVKEFWNLIFTEKKLPVVNSKIEKSPRIEVLSKNYFSYGGIPLVHLTDSQEAKLIEIRKTVERGFELLSFENNNLYDAVEVELSRLHSREFSYQGIFQKTRLRRREAINKVIDHLLNHGYLVKKKPKIFHEKKITYLSVFSFIDPGIVSYLSGETEFSESEKGYRVEGMVHSSLDYKLKNYPLKSQLEYFKPYLIDGQDKIKYQQGEIDFVLSVGTRQIPIEVKAASHTSSIQTSLMEDFLRKHKNAPFGIALYGGVPMPDPKKNILFWPYWGI